MVKKETAVKIGKINNSGVWLFVKGKKYFIDYNTYPYFKGQVAKAIKNVQLLYGFHLYWPALDIDLEIDNLENPQKYPLKMRRSV
jgi:hypothetical protein